MTRAIPSEQEVLGYFDSLSNWGRWGDDDQMGTLNFLSPDKVKRAVSLVEEGTTVSCARTVMFEPAPGHSDSSAPLYGGVGRGMGHR